MSKVTSSGRTGRVVLIVVGAVVLGLVTGLGFVALTSRTPDRETALPDKGRVPVLPTPSPTTSDTATPTASATATASATPPAVATATATATASPTTAATGVPVPVETRPGTGSGVAPSTPLRRPRPPSVGPARSVYAVDSRLFGVHDANPLGEGWPRAPVRSLRVWDAGATWRDVEPRPGRFDFSRLDAMVRTAESHGADALVVLGQTPSFHAVNPRSPSFYGNGASSMPKMTAWKRYVAKLGARYRGRAVTFQVWNEANVVGFWRGSPQQMAQLTKAAHDTLQRVNPGATLVAPALVTRLSGQRIWLDKFYAQRVGGRPVAAWVDVVSLQLYPMATGTPEASMQLLGVNRAILAKHGVNKPIWNTEVNYGMTGRPVRPLSGNRQAAYVARTYLLNAANGVRRVYWYGWETQSIVSTRMVRSDLNTLTAGGSAFVTVAQWMRGARIDTCPVDRNGTYTCTITKGGETRRVYWNPSRTASVVASAAATSVQELDGTRRRIAGGATIKVDYAPVLVK